MGTRAMKVLPHYGPQAKNTNNQNTIDPADADKSEGDQKTNQKKKLPFFDFWAILGFIWTADSKSP